MAWVEGWAVCCRANVYGTCMASAVYKIAHSLFKLQACNQVYL